MEQKKSLLEKYDIPLNHLDFGYVEKCTNAREMEKIVHILRSGEEGYFPDLLRVSEEKLKELKPDSRLFRYEEPIKQSDVLDKKELKPIMVSRVILSALLLSMQLLIEGLDQRYKIKRPSPKRTKKR